MSLAQHRRDLAQKERQLADVQKKMTSSQTKLSSASKKATDAQKQAQRTKSESIRRTKLKNVQSAQDEIARQQKAIAGYQDKESKLQKSIQQLRDRITKEEKMEQDKRDRESKRKEQQVGATFGNIDSIIQSHAKRLSALEAVPEKITILYLGTSPLDEERIRIDQEARDIREGIRMSGNPDAVEFVVRLAIRQQDILQALNEADPTIVHFSGHGSEDGKLVIEDAYGESQLVTKDAMAAVIGAAAKRVRLVVFNACFSDVESEKVLKHVDAIIGMTDSIGDEAALAFARQLYSAIGFGHDLQNAFDQARAYMAFDAPDEVDIPALHVREGMNASDIVLVSPSEQ